MTTYDFPVMMMVGTVHWGQLAKKGVEWKQTEAPRSLSFVLNNSIKQMKTDPIHSSMFGTSEPYIPLCKSLKGEPLNTCLLSQRSRVCPQSKQSWTFSRARALVGICKDQTIPFPLQTSISCVKISNSPPHIWSQRSAPHERWVTVSAAQVNTAFSKTSVATYGTHLISMREINSLIMMNGSIEVKMEIPPLKMYASNTWIKMQHLIKINTFTSFIIDPHYHNNNILFKWFSDGFKPV